MNLTLLTQIQLFTFGGWKDLWIKKWLLTLETYRLGYTIIYAWQLAQLQTWVAGGCTSIFALIWRVNVFSGFESSNLNQCKFIVDENSTSIKCYVKCALIELIVQSVAKYGLHWVNGNRLCENTLVKHYGDFSAGYIIALPNFTIEFYLFYIP